MWVWYVRRMCKEVNGVFFVTLWGERRHGGNRWKNNRWIKLNFYWNWIPYNSNNISGNWMVLASFYAIMCHCVELNLCIHTHIAQFGELCFVFNEFDKRNKKRIQLNSNFLRFVFTCILVRCAEMKLIIWDRSWAKENRRSKNWQHESNIFQQSRIATKKIVKILPKSWMHLKWHVLLIDYEYSADMLFVTIFSVWSKNSSNLYDGWCCKNRTATSSFMLS